MIKVKMAQLLNTYTDRELIGVFSGLKRWELEGFLTFFEDFTFYMPSGQDIDPAYNKLFEEFKRGAGMRPIAKISFGDFTMYVIGSKQEVIDMLNQYMQN